MSGALTSLATETLGSGIVSSALSSLLTTAAWRGVTFLMPSSDEVAGRRIATLFFPGQNDPKYQDFGRMDGPIHVRGLIIGDDYVIRAKRMRTALMKAGTGTLVHPWWGSLNVRLLEPGRLSFSDGEYRLARFEATFVRVPTTTSTSGLFSSISNTLTSVLEQADALVDSAILSVETLLSPVTVGLALASAVSSVLTSAATVWNSVVAVADEAVQSSTSTALATVTAGVTQPSSNTDTTWGDTVFEALVGVPAALANAVSSSDTSAVALASLVADGTTTDSVDASTAVTLILSGISTLASNAALLATESSVPATILTLALAAQAGAMAQAVAAQSAVSYASQDDALAGRDTLLTALDALADFVVTTNAAGATVDLSAMWAGIYDLKAAVTADISEKLGRLPVVEKIILPVSLSAWTVAYAVAGDTASDVLTTHDDIVSRNGLRHPAVCGPGTVSVLEQTS